MANKKTIKDYFNEILNSYDLSDEHRAFIEKRIEATLKKSGSAKKPTATQVANEGLKSAILEGMVVGTQYSITDMIKSIPALEDLTNQKVSALVRQLVADKLIVRTEEKGKALFALAD